MTVSTTNVADDALSKVLGPDRGHVRGFVRRPKSSPSSSIAPAQLSSVPTFFFVQPAASACPNLRLRLCGSLSVSIVVCLATPMYSRQQPRIFRSPAVDGFDRTWSSSPRQARPELPLPFLRMTPGLECRNSPTFLFFFFEPQIRSRQRLRRRFHRSRVRATVFCRRVREVTLELRSVTASVVRTNSPLFGWIRLDVKLNKKFSYISGKGFLTTVPWTETGNVTPMLRCSVYCSYVVGLCCELE
ncbi:hypothetical protein E5676_scaffold507G00480 [Cucumis melo var. makuwa]|uniref:Ty3-gypsy retrotransposon protein n=1 Tax=Cucumis melo var. makuwa TaxID=1194695 RepID=A0A5D3BKC5_CUCMM|nr:hypothetical protein E5676_scaffold507G00480 [Cucumis melo var. makuwa]